MKIKLKEIFEKKNKKRIITIITIFLVCGLIITSSIVDDKGKEQNLLRENDIAKITDYYKSKNKIEKLKNIYEKEINLLIDNKDTSSAIKYLDNYIEIASDENVVKELKYKVALLCIEDVEFYEQGLNYLESLKEYKDSLNKIKELKYAYATKTIINNLNYEKIVNLLTELTDYNDSKDKLLDIKYNYAISLSKDDNNVSKALEMLKELDSYKDSKTVYNELYNKHRFDGTWWGTDKVGTFRPTCLKWIVSGNNCYNVYNTIEVKNTYTKYYCESNEKELIIYKGNSNSDILMQFNYSNNSLTRKYNYYSSQHIVTLNKTNDSVELPDKTIVSTPKIGMTASEVKNSTWGSPKKINKSTYSWGTTEQWVYANYKYIYFENGIVTSISE